MATTVEKTPTRQPAGKKKAAAKKTTTAQVDEHNERMRVAEAEEQREREALERSRQQDAEGLDALEHQGDASKLVKGNDFLKDDEEREKTPEEKSAERRERFGDLSAKGEAKRWCIGKGPEYGGTDKQFAICTQKPLGWMARQRFFALLTKALSESVKASGGSLAGMDDVFGEGSGTLRERGQRLVSRDWSDASQFFVMAMELAHYVPNILSEAYCIWLDIHVDDRDWAKKVFEQRWDPDSGQYGLKDEDHEDLIERFIDQNYEELRSFFTQTLPRFAARIGEREKERVDRESESAPSKQSPTSGRREVATS